MNYQETTDYLFNQLPVYQNLGKVAYKADLSNTIELCNLLDNPHKNFKSIHIAGTNGKGSTSHMLASVLQEAGYKVGLYTSPHLKDFRERIRINGKEISEDYVVSFVKEYRDKFEKINLSFFEWTVGLAFHYFSEENVDIAVIETGLGGRLDSTNVITPILSVITNIGLDHTQFLGNTIELIAKEKAGIIKENVPIVIGETSDKTKDIFINIANEKSSEIVFADADKSEKEYTCDLKGGYQEKNIKTVLKSIEILSKINLPVKEKYIEQGLNNTIRNTGLLGRWQELYKTPYTVCDIGHNEDGVKEIVKQIEKTSYVNLHLVIGMVKDKDLETVLSLLPKDAKYYFCQANIARAINAEELKQLAEKHGLIGNSYERVSDAYNEAKNNAKDSDMIFIGGSAFVVAEVL